MSGRLLNNELIIMVMMYFIVSCKKDNQFGTDQNIVMTPLTGDTAVMIGKWNWIYSDHAYGWCDGDNWSEVVDPSTEGVNFSIRFLKEGMVYLYKNDSLIAEHRIVFRDFSSDSPLCETVVGSGYYIYLDGLVEKGMSGCIDYDTLMRTSFIGFFLQEQTGCGYYNNFFVKE